SGRIACGNETRGTQHVVNGLARGGTLRPLERCRFPSRKEETMPARSASQQKAAGAALAAKRGETPVSKLKGASKGMYESMSEKQLDEFASTKRKGKPEHVRKSHSGEPPLLQPDQNPVGPPG